jgi:hypothetical protein
MIAPIGQAIACIDDRTYAVPHMWFSQRYFMFLLYFVFSLCERKNEIQIKGKYLAAAGLKEN